MRFSTLDEWLAWQEQLHPRTIDLGLERVGQVWRRLGRRLAMPVITVAGTNGKGSTIAFLEAILGAAGFSTGSYTSPHLHRYNERIRLRGRPVDDGRIMAAFEAIDQARGEVPLTYFEFGTLAALWILAEAQVDGALLEVGLGGRLDAVNLVDADVAVITTIDLDHQQWLGNDREAIGREKAGIMRPGRPVVLSAPEMPRSVIDRARDLEAPLYRNGQEFQAVPQEKGWLWRGPQGVEIELPPPGLPGRHQLDNAAGAVMAVSLLNDRLPVSEAALAAGIAGARLAGRQQRLEQRGVTWLLDVAHNPEAAAALATALAAEPVAGEVHLLLGILADKAADAMIEILAPPVDHWHYLSLPGERGRSAEALAALHPGQVHHTPQAAVAALAETARPGDLVVAAGSFLTVGAVLEALHAQ